MIGGLILAAGEGRRFGGRKQLAALHGRPLLQHSIDAMRAVPALDPVVVVLGADAERIAARIDLDGVETVVCEDWVEGIAASLRAGIAALAEADAVVVTLGDQPLISPQVIAAVLDRLDHPAPAARATYGGDPGHPVLIKRRLYAAVGELRGDSGARDLLETAGVAAVECGQLCSSHDVDTPRDLKAIA